MYCHSTLPQLTRFISWRARLRWFELRNRLQTTGLIRSDHQATVLQARQKQNVTNAGEVRWSEVNFYALRTIKHSCLSGCKLSEVDFFGVYFPTLGFSLLSFAVLNQSGLTPLPAPLQPCQPSGVRGQTNWRVSRRPMWPPQALVGAIRSGSLTEDRSPSYTTIHPAFTHCTLHRGFTRPCHIPHRAAAALNKVPQDNLTGIFLFIPAASVSAQTRADFLIQRRAA